MKTTKTQSGFGHILLIVILVVAAGIASIAYVVYSRQQSASSEDDSETVTSQTSANDGVPATPAKVSDNDKDLDATDKSLDKVDPNAANQSDTKALNSQVNGL